MNKHQQDILEDLKRDILLSDGLGSNNVDRYEYKQFEVTELGFGLVSLITEVGRKTDEGTMASILCRTHRHIFISPRGGIRLANAKKKNSRRSLKNWPRGYWNAINSTTV